MFGIIEKVGFEDCCDNQQIKRELSDVKVIDVPGIYLEEGQELLRQYCINCGKDVETHFEIC